MTTQSIKLKRKKAERLDEYEGKWVALIGKEVVSSGDTLTELDERVQKMALEKRPAYFLVPRKDEGPYVLRI